MHYGPEAYAHPIRTIVLVSLLMPLVSNLHSLVAVLTWWQLRTSWLEIKKLWAGAHKESK